MTEAPEGLLLPPAGFGWAPGGAATGSQDYETGKI